MLDPKHYTLDVFCQRSTNPFEASENPIDRDLSRDLAARLRAASAKAGLSTWGADSWTIGQAVRAWLVSHGVTDREAGQAPVLEILDRFEEAAGDGSTTGDGGTGTVSQTTRWDRVKKWAGNNRGVVAFLIILAVVGGLAALATELETLLNWTRRFIGWP